MEFLQEPRFWSAIAFILFFIFFGKKIWRPLAALMDKRAIDIQEELEEVNRLRREAEEFYTNAKKEQDAAKAEAEKMLANSKEVASRLAEKAQKEAEEMAARHQQMLNQRLAASEQEAIMAVRHEAANIAIKAAREVIASVLTEEKDRQLVDQAIAGVPELLAKDHFVA